MKKCYLLMVLTCAFILVLGGQGVLAQEPVIVMPPAGHSCTSFCLDNDGFAVFGTNYDNQIHEGMIFVNKRNVAKTALDASTTGETASWVSQYGSVTFNVAAYQYAWAGMNEGA